MSDEWGHMLLRAIGNVERALLVDCPICHTIAGMACHVSEELDRRGNLVKVRQVHPKREAFGHSEMVRRRR